MMPSRRFLASLAAAACLLAPAWSAAAPKKPDHANGCTASDFDSPGGQACMRRLDDDLLNDRTWTHVLVCDVGGGALCCKTDGTRLTACKSARAAASAGIPVRPSVKATDKAD